MIRNRCTIQFNDFTCKRCGEFVQSAYEDFQITSENNVITVVHLKCPITVDGSKMGDPFYCGDADDRV